MVAELMFAIYLVLTPFHAPIQRDVSEVRLVARAYGLDVRETVRRLFESVQVSYSLDNSVRGKVTIDFPNATFEQDLQTIVKQVNATYRCESGVYQIIPRDEFSAPDPGKYNPASIAIDNADTRLALAEIFRSLKTNIVIDPGVGGKMSYHFRPRSEPELLETLMDQSNTLIWSTTGPQWRISPRLVSPAVFRQIDTLPYSLGARLVKGDEIYTLRRNKLTKQQRTKASVTENCLARSWSESVFNLHKAQDRKRLQFYADQADVQLQIAPEAKGVIRISPGLATIEHLEQSIEQSTKIQPEFGLFLKHVDPFVSLNLFLLQPISEDKLPLSKIAIIENILQVDCGR